MMYLAIIFIPPVYFYRRKMWGGFALNLILYGMACLLLVTFVLAMVAPLFWILAVGHASWYLKKEMMNEHAELIATKMAEKMSKANSAGA